MSKLKLAIFTILGLIGLGLLVPHVLYFCIVISAVSLFVFGLLFSKSESTPVRYINSKGYVVLAQSGELEHRHMAKQLLGRDLAEDEVVHHINGKRADNEIRNLCLMNCEKHEFFHAWLRWKKEKSGRYPSINDQRRVLEKEYGGTLLEKIKPIEQARLPDKIETVEGDKINSDDSEIFVIRRNKVTNKMFVEFDETVLISPEGKDIEIDPERFGEPEEVPASELTKRQLTACKNKMNARESEAVEHDERLNQQRKLFVELRKERKRIAAEKGVPAYVVFDDKTLIEMSEVMPMSETLMLQIKGVDPEKFRLYGAYFIDVVKRFKRTG